MIKIRIDTSSQSVRFPSGCDPSEAVPSGKTGGMTEPGLVDPGLRRLMLALLEDALESYQKFFVKPSRKMEIQFREVEEWIASESEGLFSFKNVCESLGIDPAWLRRELILWREGRRMEVGDAGFSMEGSLAGKGKAPSATPFNPGLQKKGPAVA